MKVRKTKLRVLPKLATDVNDVVELRRRLYTAELKVVLLEERLRLVRIEKYGPASEKLGPLQLELLEWEPRVSRDEVAAEAGREPTIPAAVAPQPRARIGRQTLPADLPPLPGCGRDRGALAGTHRRQEPGERPGHPGRYRR